MTAVETATSPHLLLDRQTRRNAAIDIALDLDADLLMDNTLSEVVSDVPPESSSPQGFIHTPPDNNLQHLIIRGTNELAIKHSRRVLFSALHGMMGYVHPWNRAGPTRSMTWPSRRDVLLSNTEVLQTSGIDITDPLNLDVLAGSAFKTFHTAMHEQYVYLVAANLAKTEYRITDQGLKDLQLAVFAYVTGHNDYRSAV